MDKTSTDLVLLLDHDYKRNINYSAVSTEISSLTTLWPNANVRAIDSTTILNVLNFNVSSAISQVNSTGEAKLGGTRTLSYLNSNYYYHNGSTFEVNKGFWVTPSSRYNPPSGKAYYFSLSSFKTDSTTETHGLRPAVQVLATNVGTQSSYRRNIASATTITRELNGDKYQYNSSYIFNNVTSYSMQGFNVHYDGSRSVYCMYLKHKDGDDSGGRIWCNDDDRGTFTTANAYRHGNDITYDTANNKYVIHVNSSPFKLWETSNLRTTATELDIPTTGRQAIAYDNDHNSFYVGNAYYLTSVKRGEGSMPTRAVIDTTTDYGFTRQGIEYHQGYIYDAHYNGGTSSVSTNSWENSVCNSDLVRCDKYAKDVGIIYVYNAKLNANGQPSKGFGKLAAVLYQNFLSTTEVGSFDNGTPIHNEIEGVSFNGLDNRMFMGTSTQYNSTTFYPKVYSAYIDDLKSGETTPRYMYSTTVKYIDGTSTHQEKYYWFDLIDTNYYANLGSSQLGWIHSRTDNGTTITPNTFEEKNSSIITNGSTTKNGIVDTLSTVKLTSSKYNNITSTSAMSVTDANIQTFLAQLTPTNCTAVVLENGTEKTNGNFYRDKTYQLKIKANDTSNTQILLKSITPTTYADVTATIPTNSLCVARTYTGSAQQLTSVTSGTGYTLSGYSQTNAGTHTITATLASGYKWSDNTTGTKTFTCSMSPKALTVPSSPSDKTYNGSSQTSGITCPSGSTAGGTQSAKDVGNYTQTCTLSSTTNYKWSDNTTSAKSISWKINPKSVAVSWGTTTNFSYTGSAQAPTASASSGVSGETINITRTTGTNVGSYTSTASCSSVTGGQAKCSNYTLTGTTKGFTITAVEATCPSITAYSGTYDGSAHSITVSGGSGGTLEYRTSTTVTWSATKPSRTDAGTTTVYVQVVGDSNHTTKDCGSKDITINSQSITVPTSPTDKTYNGSSQLSGITCPSNSVASGEQTAIDAGTHNLVCTLDSTINYKWSDGTTTPKNITWKINPKSIVVSWDELTWTYDGTEHSAVAAASTGVSSETMKLSIINNSITNNGTKNVTASCSSITGGQAKCSNYTLTNTNKTLTVNKKAITITAKGQTIDYEQEIKKNPNEVIAETLVNGEILSEITLTPSTSNATTSGKITPSNAKVLRGTVDTTENYNISYVQGNLTIKPILATLSCEDKTYDGTEQTSCTCSGGVVQGENKATNYRQEPYEVSCSPDENHLAPANEIWKINKKEITITARDQNIRYGQTISKTTRDITTNGLINGHKVESIVLTQSTTNPTRTGKIIGSGAVINDESDVLQTDNYKINYIPGNLIIVRQDSYLITFNSNGGSSIQPIEATYGDRITEPAKPAKLGYEFKGWYSDELLNNQYTFSTMPATNLTLYAKWKPIEYDLSYNLNGGEATNPGKYTIETETFTLNNPTKEGHTFKGWTGSNGNTPEKNITIEQGTTGNKSYTANYDVNSYTISFDSNGGTTINSITKNYGENIEAPTNPEKEGYRFAGWCSDQELTKFYSFTTMPAKDLTLYAKWTDNDYIINYELDNGVNDESNPTTFTNGDTITINNPTKKGYTFKGWYTDSNYTNKIESITSNINSDLTLYAKWSINTYKIELETNGGNSLPVIETEYESSIPKIKNPERRGYTFKGWYTDSELTNEFNEKTMPAENLTLYAKWKINRYKITFNSNGGSKVASIEDDYNTIINKPADPYKQGYEFKGWYSDKQLTKLYEFNKIPAENLTLYAKWSLIGDDVYVPNTGNNTSIIAVITGIVLISSGVYIFYKKYKKV